MSWDIYGNPLRRGYCEVHPDVHQEYPCSICMAQKQQQSQPHNELEQLQYEFAQQGDYIRHLESERAALAAQVLKLEKRIKAINEGVEEYKSMSNDATACLVHKALMSVREEIIQRDLYQTAPDFIEQFANQYADSIRQGVK